VRGPPRARGAPPRFFIAQPALSADVKSWSLVHSVACLLL